MKIVAGTNNPAKLREITDALPQGIEIVGLGLAGAPAPEEAGSTFGENALIKARYYWRLSGMVTVADDSGLEVEELWGRPGIMSARYAGQSATDGQRIERLLEEMAGVTEEKRRARFLCAAALVWPGGQRLFVGTVEGVVLTEGRGSRGFGYDPIFYYPPSGMTFGEMTAEEKLEVSHRGKAFRGLSRWLAGHFMGNGTGLRGAEERAREVNVSKGGIPA